MLGSFFDLKREVARIAAKRAAAEAGARAEEQTPTHFSDFDGRLQDFVRSFQTDDHGDAIRSAPERHGRSGSH